MSRRFLTPIDLLQNELQNARVQNLGTAPADPVAGQIYFDTTTSAFRFYDGAAWVDVISMEGTITQVNVSGPLTSTGGTSPTLDINEATQTSDGSMSAADKTKLDGIAANATANSDDATLLARANHTGTQAISTVDGLQTALDGKEDDGTAAAAVDAHEASATPVHTTAQITGLDTTLASKMDDADFTKANVDALGVDAATVGGDTAAELRDRATHTGTQGIATVDGLQGALDAKVDDALVGVADGIASLDGTGRVPSAQLPALALTDVSVVASIAERDALDVQEGDVAVVTGGASYIYDGTAWVEMSAPDTGVQAVTATAPITSSGGANPDIGLAAGGVDTEYITDGAVTLAKLAPEVVDQLGTTKAAATVGDGAATAFAITHGMGTRDVSVSVFQNSGAYAEVMADVERTDVDTVTVRFATAPAVDSYRVVVVG